MKRDYWILGILVTLLIIALGALVVLNNGNLKKTILTKLGIAKEEKLPDYWGTVPDLGKVAKVSSRQKKEINQVTSWEMVAEKVDRKAVDKYIGLLKQSGLKYKTETNYGEVVEEVYGNENLEVYLRYNTNGKPGKVVAVIR